MSQELDPKELNKVCWEDNDLYGRVFFPNAFRQQSPQFHAEMDAIMAEPHNRQIGFKVFRGGAKTTKARVFAGKRIAYGISRTIMAISRSQYHANATVEWLQKQVQFNTKWAQFYQLKPGQKWSPGTGDIEIIHEGFGHTVRVIGAGITGQVRGFNFEDYRPDLIIGDDIDDEETTNTPEQRTKTGNLWHGAIANSLTPQSENPWAQQILLQTPLHLDDQISLCSRDDSWVTRTFGCFTDQGESRWPARWSTRELNKMKASYTARNQLGLWMREMECTLVSLETKAFRAEWLNYWDVLPDSMVVYIAVDPAFSDSKYGDYQAVCVIGVSEGKVFLLEYALAKQQDPEQLISELFRLHRKWKPRVVGVEGGSYQKTLKWYIDRSMQRANYWMTVVEIIDRRPKEQRIRDGIRDMAYNGMIYIKKEHTEFIQQYSDYEAQGRGGIKHDDLLDAFTMAMGLINPYESGLAAETGVIEKAALPLPANWRMAP